MAAIDKIYGTQEQYDELFNWLKTNKPYAIRYMYMRDGWMLGEERPIANFSYKIDMWLKDNCPIQFVQDRLFEQYTSKF